MLLAGRPEMRTASSVTAAATRSSAECAASERIPSDPVSNPTMSFMAVRKIAATTDQSATKRFSRSASVCKIELESMGRPSKDSRILHMAFAKEENRQEGLRAGMPGE